MGTDGRVEPGSIQILEASNAAFMASARAAIEKAIFHPGELQGQVVRVQVQMPVRFVLVGKK